MMLPRIREIKLAFLNSGMVTGLSVLMMGWFVGYAQACSFHTVLPEKSFSNHLAGASHIAFARENSNRPFTFHIEHKVQGDFSNLDIPLLVDSATRRRLKINGGDTVLLARSADDGSWHRLAYVHESDRELFNRLVRERDHWSANIGFDAKLETFEALQDHPRAALQRIALTELDKTPYSQLRTMDVRLSADELQSSFLDRFELPWVPIRILMLGILGDAEAKSAVRRAIERARSSGLERNLGAWSTAFIEIEGGEAVNHLTREFLLSGTQSRKSIEMVLTAFAVQRAQGEQSIRPVMDANIAEFLAVAPDFAPLVAKVFGAQNDYTYSSVLREAMKSGKLRNPRDLILVASYLSLAKEAAVPSE